MATKLWLSKVQAPIHFSINEQFRFGSIGNFWPVYLKLVTALPSGGPLGITSNSVITPSTNGITINDNLTTCYRYISDPVDADISFAADTITANLWALESSMLANCAINFDLGYQSTIQERANAICSSARTTELGTSAAVQNFTATSGTLTVPKGSRLTLDVWCDDIPTAPGGHTYTVNTDGPTAAANGDSWIELTQTFGFMTAPAGTKMYLTDVASPYSYLTDTTKKLDTAKGSGVTSKVANTSSFQWTDGGGGSSMSWWSEPLIGFTLSGRITLNMRALESNVLANTGISIRIYKNTTQIGWPAWGSWASDGGTERGELGTTETLCNYTFGVPDTVFADGDRLGILVFVDGMMDAAKNGAYTATLYYNGTTDAASGDTWIQLTQTVTPLNIADVLGMSVNMAKPDPIRRSLYV